MFAPHMKKWLRFVANVPAGFVRFYMIKSLKEKPMSGSEIMDAIEKETNGRWKPSPGSIYPFLAWLQDNKYTKEVSSEEAGIRRYTLTEKGEQFFKEQTELKEKLEEKLAFLTPPFLGGLLPEKMKPLKEPMRRLTKSLFDLRAVIMKNVTEKSIKEVAVFLDKMSEEIDELRKGMKEKEFKD